MNNNSFLSCGNVECKNLSDTLLYQCQSCLNFFCPYCITSTSFGSFCISKCFPLIKNETLTYTIHPRHNQTNQFFGQVTTQSSIKTLLIPYFNSLIPFDFVALQCDCSPDLKSMTFTSQQTELPLKNILPLNKQISNIHIYLLMGEGWCSCNNRSHVRCSSCGLLPLPQLSPLHLLSSSVKLSFNIKTSLTFNRLSWSGEINQSQSIADIFHFFYKELQQHQLSSNMIIYHHFSVSGTKITKLKFCLCHSAINKPLGNFFNEIQSDQLYISLLPYRRSEICKRQCLHAFEGLFPHSFLTHS